MEGVNYSQSQVLPLAKVKCFLWQCYHKSIPVGTILTTKGMDVSPTCHICNTGSKTILHMLRDCHIARNLWNSLSLPFLATSFFGLQLNDWLWLNCYSTKTQATSNIHWGIIFAFGIWTLWIYRNDVVFRNERSRCSLKQEVLVKATKFAYIIINGKQTINHQRIRVSWLKPRLHWHKLNSDGSSLGNPR